MATAKQLRWLILAVRASYDASARAPLAASNPPEWSQVAQLAARHRVEGLAWDGLVQSGYSVPPAFADIFKYKAERVAAKHLVSIAAAATLAERFESKGVDLIFLKGVVLAALAYPRPQVKDSCDIDLLVAPEDIGRAAEILNDMGYRNVLPASSSSLVAWHGQRKESVWVDPASGIQLDLHSRLADNPTLIPAIGMATPRRLAAIGGRQLATLSDEAQFAYLCVHGASSAWFRLKWLTDLHAFLLAHSCAHLDRWIDQSVEMGGGRTASAALGLLHHWFDLPISPEAARMDGFTRLTLAISNSQLVHPVEPTERTLGTLTIHIFQLLQRPTIGFAVREAIRQVAEKRSR